MFTKIFEQGLSAIIADMVIKSQQVETILKKMTDQGYLSKAEANKLGGELGKLVKERCKSNQASLEVLGQIKKGMNNIIQEWK